MAEVDEGDKERAACVLAASLFYYLPVLPNPPMPRGVEDNSSRLSTISISGVEQGIVRSCANRSP